MKKVIFSIVSLIFFLFSYVVPPVAFAQHEIIESIFCLLMDRPECAIPCVGDTIRLSQIQTTENGEKQLYFWTKVRVDEDKNIMHVWSAKSRNEEWAERFHVAKSDRLITLAVEIYREVKKVFAN